MGGEPQSPVEVEPDPDPSAAAPCHISAQSDRRSAASLTVGKNSSVCKQRAGGAAGCLSKRSAAREAKQSRRWLHGSQRREGGGRGRES